MDRRVLAVLAAALIAVAGLTWAKWWPYTIKIDGLVDTRAWDGGALIDVARDAPTWWAGAWDFAFAYTDSVWKALLVGLLIAAAIDALLPREHIARFLARRGTVGGAAIGGAAAVPSMMCTCCASPVAVSLRRSGVPLPAVLAYWLGNPVLNPAVVVFLALVGPWEWAATRVVVGVVLVFGAALLAARLAPGMVTQPPALDAGTDPVHRPAPVRLLRSFSRFTLTLVPEYLGVVMLVGAVAHALPEESGWSELTLLGLVVLVVLSVLMVIPTGGEIPLLLTLAAVGASPWVLGLVLVALPAVSLPSLVMVRSSLSSRITVLTVVLVALAGLAAGAVLMALT